MCRELMGYIFKGPIDTLQFPKGEGRKTERLRELAGVSSKVPQRTKNTHPVNSDALLQIRMWQHHVAMLFLFPQLSQLQ